MRVEGSDVVSEVFLTFDLTLLCGRLFEERPLSPDAVEVKELFGARVSVPEPS